MIKHGLLFFLLALASAFFAVTGCFAAALPDLVHLSWSGDTATTMTISWRADSERFNRVQYQASAAFSAQAKDMVASSRLFKSELGSTRLFHAALVNLLPGTRYIYRVGDGVNWGAAHYFTTAVQDEQKFSFLVFGDSQSVPPYRQWRDTLQAAFRAHPEAKFFLNVGDLVDTGQSGAQWQAWFAASAGVIDTIPAMPVVGNHECYGANGSGIPQYFNQLFFLPQNGPSGLENQVYSFSYGSLQLFALDSQQGEQRKARGDIFSSQKKWLDAELAASKSRWKIAFFHKSPYDLHAGNTNLDVKKAFCPTLEKGGVQLVFNGHDHGLSRTFPLMNGIRAPRGKTGTIYMTCGRSGTKTYKDIRAHVQNEFFYNPLDQPNYLLVEVSAEKLTVNSYKTDGTVIDSLQIVSLLPAPVPVETTPPVIEEPQPVYGLFTPDIPWILAERCLENYSAPG